MANQEDLKVGDLVKVKGFHGVACGYCGPHTEPGLTEWWDDDAEEMVYDEEPEDVETGRAVVHMVGDNQKFVVDFEDITVIPDDEDICSCGQLGCGWG